MQLKYPVIGVDIFLERRKTRLHVGVLKKDGEEFVFTYDDFFLKAPNVLALGPEFPMGKRTFRSTKLFPTFEDRIPSRENPAYPEYCQMMGISPNEKDPFVLLSTIGRKGPSCFIFAPIFEREFTADDVIKFRQLLGLTTREFAMVFEISQSSLNALERKRSSGKDLLKRIRLIILFPEVAQYLLHVNGYTLKNDKWKSAYEAIKGL